MTTLPLESAPPEATTPPSGGPLPGAARGRWRVPLLIGRRVIGAVVSLAAIVLFNFFLFNVLSSNPIQALVRNRHLDAASQAQLKHEFGYDKSKWAQFGDYVEQLFLHHNLGISTYYTQPVWGVIVDRIWPTLLLVGVSTVLSSVLGTWIGIKGAWDRGSTFDKISNGVSVTLYSVPEFWLGLVILLFLAGDTVGLGWFPLGGIYDDDVDPASFAGWVNIGWHLVLPGLTLTLAYLAQYQLVMRSSMLDEMGQDYVQTARAKGLRELAVRRQHVVPNALLPAVTQILLYFGFVISGALLVETVFSWPGLGLLTETAVSSADFPLLRGLFLLFTASVIVCNLIADVMIGVLDPRVREL